MTVYTDVVLRNGQLLFVANGDVATGTVVSATSFDVVSSGGVAIATSVYNGGDEIVDGGLAENAVVNNGGYEIVSGGTALDPIVNDGGFLVVQSGTTINHEFVPGATASGATINDGGSEVISSGGAAVSTTVNAGGYEIIYSGGTAADTVVHSGGMIDLTFIPYASGGSASVDSNDVLTVSVGGQSYTQQLSGDYSGVPVQLAPGAPDGGTLATVACYRAGTKILTDRGERAVEQLRTGDRVRTMWGDAFAPITWTGRRDVDCTAHAEPAQVYPVRVAAGAFGPGRPYRDLFLSPDHAVYVNAVLIPVKLLMNGSTIRQVPVERVSYHHIALARHNVVLAEGLAAETYLDTGRFDATVDAAARWFADFPARMWEAYGCAPLVAAGYELRAARALLAQFAAAPGTEDDAGEGCGRPAGAAIAQARSSGAAGRAVAMQSA